MTKINFNLVGYFSRTSAVVIIIIALITGAISFYFSTKYQTSATEIQHHKITQILINVLEDELKGGIDSLGPLSKEEIKKHPDFNKIDNQVRKLFQKNTIVLKVKIYNLNAKVIYSTDDSQIAHQSDLDYVGTDVIMSRQINSKYDSKKDWESLKGKLKNVEILASYVPIVIDDGTSLGKVIGVAEIYSEAGVLNKEKLQNAVLLGLISFFLMFFLFLLLLLIVKKGEEIIFKQSIEIDQHKDQLYATAKLNSLGEMAGGIAHEINNPLAIIDGKARKITNLLNLKDDNFESNIHLQVSDIRSTVNRISVIIKGLKNISRNGEQDPFQKIKVIDVINETLILCSENFKHNNVILELEVIPRELTVECRYVQISQCLLNLLTNSYQAIEKLEVKKISINAYDDKGYIVLKISDSGLGIPKEIRNKIFEPMFTTKEVGVGTGLGLSITASIINQHGGTISIDESVPHTCFVVRLPSLQSSKF